MVVVVLQGDALRRQLGLELVGKRHEFGDGFFTGQVGAGNDDVLVADGLVVSHGLLKMLGDFLPAGVGAGNGQAVFIQPGFHFFRRVTEEPGELHAFIADFGNLFQRTFQVFAGDVPQAVHLQSVFHNYEPLFLLSIDL